MSDHEPGTPAARFDWLLDELIDRFGDPEPWSARAPELRLLKAIDDLRHQLAERDATLSIPEMLAQIQSADVEAMRDQVTALAKEVLELQSTLRESDAKLAAAEQARDTLRAAAEAVREAVHRTADHTEWFEALGELMSTLDRLAALPAGDAPARQA